MKKKTKAKPRKKKESCTQRSYVMMDGVISNYKGKKGSFIGLTATTRRPPFQETVTNPSTANSLAKAIDDLARIGMSKPVPEPYRTILEQIMTLTHPYNKDLGFAGRVWATCSAALREDPGGQQLLAAEIKINQEILDYGKKRGLTE